MNRQNGFVGILGHRLEEELYRNTVMVWELGELALPWHIPSHGAKKKGKDGSYVYILWKTLQARSSKLPASNQQNMQWKSTPWSQLIRNLTSVIPKTRYLMHTEAKWAKKEGKKCRTQVSPLNLWKWIYLWKADSISEYLNITYTRSPSLHTMRKSWFGCWRLVSEKRQFHFPFSRPKD